MNTEKLQPTTNALDIANYLVQIANQVDENDLTNLKLQKLLYFCQLEYLKETGQPLFPEEIQAWKWGPVIPQVYHAFKASGNFPITFVEITDKDFDKKLSKETKNFVQKVWKKYGIYSAHRLADVTHKPNSPWQKHYVAGENRVIPISALVQA